MEKIKNINITNQEFKINKKLESEIKDKKIWKAAKDFEAFFISQLFKEMRKSVPKSNFLGNSKREEIFQSLLDEEISKDISKGTGFGIAEILYKQLTSNNSHKKENKG